MCNNNFLRFLSPSLLSYSITTMKYIVLIAAAGKGEYPRALASSQDTTERLAGFTVAAYSLSWEVE